MDFREGKNHVGTFYQPRLVVADLDTLRTLPAARAAERRGGGREARVPGGRRAAGASTRGRRSSAASPRPGLVAGCVRFKAAVVGGDEREETGGAPWLNLGHTLGHAIEAAGGFDAYPHGEAVGLGLRAALWLSQRLTGLDPADVSARPGAARRGRGRRSGSSDVPVDEVLRLVARDKKAGAGRPGSCCCGRSATRVGSVAVPVETQREVLAWLTTR